jgi:hypothetical protein
MAIAVVIDVPGLTADQHDALVDAMGLTDQPAAAVPGMIFHVSGPTATGWRVIDVWADEAAMVRFQRERLGPAVAQIGGMPQPQVQVTPVHEMQR